VARVIANADAGVILMKALHSLIKNKIFYLLLLSPANLGAALIE
jgi:hypothetical protein